MIKGRSADTHPTFANKERVCGGPVAFAKGRTVCATREIIIINGDNLIEDMRESLIRESFRHGESKKTNRIRMFRARPATLNDIEITDRLNFCK